jgi:pimeloyl-ACP methyl ester carboxylesterase
MVMARRRVGIVATSVTLAVMTVACSDDPNDAATTTAAGATPTAAASGPSSSSNPASTAAQPDIDEPVDIGGGRSLHVHCTGQGEPTVILESGYHDSASLWSQAEPQPPAVGPSVQEQLAQHVRVCSYDRPGTIVRPDINDPTQLSLTKVSTSVPMPRPASAAVEDLYALIAAADLPTPVVIVAHSMGGLLTRLYAETYPDDVAGIVFVDAFPAEMRDAMGDQWSRYVELLAHPGTSLDDDPGFEVFDLDASIDEVVAGGAMPKVPMAVLTKTEPFPIPATEAALGTALEQAWTKTSTDLVAFGEGTPHVFATATGHYIQVLQPDLVADTALLVIRRAGG